MDKSGVCTLLLEKKDSHGVFDAQAVERTELYCTVRGVRMTESYQAMSHGFMPELVICLAHAEEYNGERKLEYEGHEYDIIRTFLTESDGMELTVQRSVQA